MDNELITKDNWWKRNWKWLVPTCVLLFFFGIWLALTLIITGNIDDYAQAYSDTLLYEKAFEKAKTNDRIIAVLGNLEPIDQLAIIEGDVKYSNNGNSVDLSIRIQGTKGRGKMDIVADKKGTVWNYKKINVRIRQSKEVIQIIKSSI
jgi:hypothetical protein